MANTAECDFIEFDSHDDILVRTLVDSRIEVEFVQVKAHASANYWKPSDLYSDESDLVPAVGKSASSLVAKQLRRAKGDDIASFRIVTRIEVNQDLAVLKDASSLRDPAKLKKLKDNLVPRFAHLTFPNGRNVANWIDKVRWQVSGPEQAVDDRNLHAIANAVFAHLERTLTPEQVQELYRSLLNRVRYAASLREPRDQKGCARPQLLAWLNDYCSRLPIHLPPNLKTVIAALTRESYERCVGRWLNAGVDAELAERLAADGNVGTKAVQWLLEQPESFLWINGQFGAGKSLAVDRLYQRALDQYREGRNSQIPVFIEAKTLRLPLDEEIAVRASAIGAYYRQGVYAVIDGADERTHQEARQLVQDAANYARSHPESKVLITSSILEVSGFSSKLFPPLTESEADDLLSLLSGSEKYACRFLDARFETDLGNPFFVIQCARFGPGLSRAELVRRMVAAALERVETAIQPAEELLARLAQWQFDHGSPLIPAREIGPFQASITSILQTRLLERRGDHFAFTIECVAHWYAAQAIELGLVSISNLCRDIARLERWQFALAMVLNHADSNMADRIMRPLAELQPAFASLVLRDGLLDWAFGDRLRNVDAAEVADRIWDAMRAWKVGLEPISSMQDVFPVNAQGELLKITASCSEGSYLVDWHEHHDYPVVSSDLITSPQSLPGGRSFSWFSGILDHPAWAWKATHGVIKRNLDGMIHELSLAACSERLLWELAWAEGCDLLGESKIRSSRIPLTTLARKMSYGFRWLAPHQLMEVYVNSLVARGCEFLEAPFPQGDQEPRGHWMSQYFSHGRMVARASSIYEAALLAFREVIEALFPKMADRFPRYAAWPFDIEGVVFLSKNEDSYYLEYAMESRSAGTMGRARFSAGSEADAIRFRKDWREMKEARDTRKPSWHLQSWGAAELELWGPNPTAKIVSDWLKSDLGAVGWL